MKSSLVVPLIIHQTWKTDDVPQVGLGRLVHTFTPCTYSRCAAHGTYCSVQGGAMNVRYSVRANKPGDQETWRPRDLHCGTSGG